MKSVVFFTVLVVAVSGQRLRNTLIGELCGNLEVPDCRIRARECISIRSAEGAISRRASMLACARENGVTRSSLLEAMQAARNPEGGDVLENLPIDLTIVNQIRSCVYDKEGLVDSNGNPDPELIKANLSGAFSQNLSDRPGLLQAMLDALGTCPEPISFQDELQFRKCLATTCIQNFE